MDIAKDIPQLRRIIRETRLRGSPIAFVPTMGNLHAGHLSLVKEARARAGFTVASIFINPFQFGAGEDYEGYPRTLDDDIDKLREAGVDLLFTPGVGDLYPQGLEAITRVEVPEIGKILCGASRPTFFRGITTVVSMLFHLVEPTWAFLGEKDYQQLLIIRRMVSDLKMPVEIIPVPTTREADGLAMSSRNGYLTMDERQRAPVLYRALREARDSLAAGKGAGEGDIAAIRTREIGILRATGFRPDYFEIRRAADLGVPEAIDLGQEEGNLRILAAAWLGKARLIDNIAA